MDEEDTTSEIGVGTKLIVGALAVIGCFSLISWILGWLLGFVRFALIGALAIAIVYVLLTRRKN